MRRILLIFIFLTLVTALNHVSAQESLGNPGSSASAAVSENNLGTVKTSQTGIFDWLINLFRKNNTSDIDLVAKSSLPALDFIPVQSGMTGDKNTASTANTQESQDKSSGNQREIEKIVSSYTYKNSAVKPVENPTKTASSDLMAFFNKILGIGTPSQEQIIKEGNQQAGELAAINLPGALSSSFQGRIAQEASHDQFSGNNQEDERILGSESDARMGYALQMIQCAQLPNNLLDCPVLSLNSLAQGESPWSGPTSSPEAAPVVPSPSAPSSVSCTQGSGYCLVSYLNDPSRFKDLKDAQVASYICQRESGGDPMALNDKCFSGVSQDYSVGLFQINLLAHLEGLIKLGIIPADCRGIINDEWDTGRTCTTSNKNKLMECAKPLMDPEKNIQYALFLHEFSLSNYGIGWQPWRTPDNICESQETPSVDFVRVPKTQLYLQDFDKGNIRPSKIVIHWSGGWSSAQATADYLRTGAVAELGYPLSCHLATDENQQLQLLKYFANSSQRAWCVGGDENDTALNNELTGLDFDEVLANPGRRPDQYKALMAETAKALESTCWMMKKYGINISGIKGHFELTVGKTDPGPAYLQYFKDRLATECR